MTSTSSLHKTPLAGKEAFVTWLSLAFQIGEPIWLKIGHDRFFTGSVSLSGHLSVWATRGSDKNRRKTIYHSDGYDYLSKLAQSLDGGAFYIPGKPSEYPLKEFCLASDDIGGEMDDGTADEQWQRIELIAQLSGLIPGYIISSGGKSAHPHWKLTAAVPIAKRTFYSRLMAIALLGDPAVTNPHQPMRVPGFFRKEKNKEQTLQFYSDSRYTAQEFEAGMQRCFENLGFTWWEIEQFSESRWRLVRKILVSKQPRQEKEGKIRELLAQPEAVINPPRLKSQPVTDFQYSGVSIPLEFFLSRNHKQLLEAGEGDGNRDNAGYALAKDLIGVVDTLPRLGINYQGDARQLFEDFAARCSPSLADRDIDRIWRSASRGTSKATLTDDQILSRAFWWQRQQNPSTIGRHISYDEPDSRLYAEYLERDSGDAIAASSQEFQFLFNKASNKVKRFLSKAFKGFGNKPVTAHRIAPKVLKIKLGEVPTPDEYEILGKPRLDFKGDPRLGIWSECVAKGWKHILDSSGTGSGKSYKAGEAQPSDLQVEQLWYMAIDHRNPTTSTVEAEYTDLPVRNNGFKIDPTRKTPLGKSFQVWGEEEDEKDSKGNCDRTDLFHALAAKNIDVQESARSPICMSCPHMQMTSVPDGNGKTNYRPKCSSKSGEGFGFRGEYSNALNSPKLRAHPNSAPQPKTDFSLDDDGNFIDPGFDYRSAGAFWDEAGTLIEFKNLIEVTLKDLEKIYCKVPTLLSACLLDEFKHDLDPLWQVLMGLLDPSFRGYIPDSERFGMNNRDIRALLPLRPENINKIIEFLKTELAPDLSFLQEKGDGIDFKSVLREDRRSAALANLALNAQDSRQKAQKLEDLMLNWFVPFLEAWRDNSGYFKRDFGTVLKIYSPSDRHTDVASSMKWNIYLDATLSPQMLGDILGTEDILHIKQQMPSYQNLRMIQVTGMGTLSSDRRESASLRVQAVLTELQTRHPDLAVIDWKSKATSGQGYHFRDGRGVNRFALASALAIVGTPCPNIGALAINYQLLKNKPVVEDSSEFRAFVDEHIQAELVQEAGRLRANLRPDEQLTLYFCGDYALDFIKDHLPGVQMEQLDAFRISPDAGDRCQRTKYRILKVFAELIDAGEDSAKITQEQIAVKAEIARSRISQIASVFGGWATLRKLLVLLCKTLYNKTNNSENPPQPGEELNSDLLWMANDYLPLLATNLEELPPMEVVEEILHIIKAEGWHRFKAVLKLTDTTSKMAILGYLISLFPSIWREEFT